ncbi:MAG: uroporphyrinogen-III C-methyltransferase [Halobacteriales archaeon SW_9_67_25]|nr:MAG: uroporphyrinogen-III C-methyltransferase [Halobacteriales archaeon SW_9_67_25]
MDERHESAAGSPDPPRGVEGRPAATSPGIRGRTGPVVSAAAGEAPPVEEAHSETASTATGHVYLVGAGPGDPDLLTRRAWTAIEGADAVLYDSLTGGALLSELPDGVTAVDVGKRPPDPVSQAEIHDRLVSRAGGGETVVRLKGGDPTVFGRGGEEAQHLASEGIPFEIVPGVSSVLAAPSAAGIPLTHRDYASSVTVVTGHEAPDKADSALDWDSLAATVQAGGTLVVLMGVAKLPDYVARLREGGVGPRTGLALVEKASWPAERTVTATLGTAVETAREADVSPPAVTVIGDVVGVREQVVDALRE